MPDFEIHLIFKKHIILFKISDLFWPYLSKTFLYIQLHKFFFTSTTNIFFLNDASFLPSQQMVSHLIALAQQSLIPSRH